MSNILTDSLPETVMVNGREYLIDTDYRASLRVVCAHDAVLGLTSQELQGILLCNLYGRGNIPEDTVEALHQGIVFIDGGEDQDDEPKGKVKHSEPLYSFNHDARFIFAAFRQTHGIDLESTHMHWWKFIALFLDLGHETTFCGLTSLRKRLNDNTATKDERRLAMSLGSVVYLPKVDRRTPEQRRKAGRFFELLQKGQGA